MAERAEVSRCPFCPHCRNYDSVKCRGIVHECKRCGYAWASSSCAPERPVESSIGPK